MAPVRAKSSPSALALGRPRQPARPVVAPGLGVHGQLSMAAAHALITGCAPLYTPAIRPPRSTRPGPRYAGRRFRAHTAEAAVLESQLALFVRISRPGLTTVGGPGAEDASREAAPSTSLGRSTRRSTDARMRRLQKDLTRRHRSGIVVGNRYGRGYESFRLLTHEGMRP